jgi:hypothetical protein
VTADLPDAAGCRWVWRSEARSWRIEHREEGGVERFWRGGAALRVTRPLGREAFVTATGRLDGETGRRRALQARLEGQGRWGLLTFFGVLSRGERIPERGEIGSENEVHESAEVGLRVDGSRLHLRAVAFGTRIRDRRPEPTFEEVRARTPVPGAPAGRARIRGGSLGLSGGPWGLPGLRFLGRLSLRTDLTRLSAEETHTGAPLPGRARWSWTGEGFLERRLFGGELLARVRGRLAHRRGRVDGEGKAVPDLWMTDVPRAGEGGDVVFFYRFHDLLERADEVEPGIRFPGFSRMYGLTWRFWG